MTRRLIKATASLTAAILAAATFAVAAPGDLDPTFGTAGRATVPDGTAHAVLLQSDGKIVLSGTKPLQQQYVLLVANDYFLRRLLANGSPDNAWGASGTLSGRFMGGAYLGYSSSGEGIALRSDGKLLIAGPGSADNVSNMAVARYTAGGGLDSTFGGETNPAGQPELGVRRVDFDGRNDGAKALLSYPDGRILLAGYSASGSVSTFAIARLAEGGNLDMSFGTGGKVTLAIGTGRAEATAAALQPDGKILIGGFSTNATVEEFALVRYLSTGALDTSFGVGGIVSHPIVGGGRIRALAVLPDGKILAVGGNTGGSNEGFALARYNAGGSLDTAFGTIGLGVVRTALPSKAAATGLAVQPDGRILVVGHTPGAAGNQGLIVARYGANGVLDPTFGASGIVTRLEMNNARDSPVIAAQPDGKAVVAAGLDVARFLLEMPVLSPDSPLVDFGGHSMQTTTRSRTITLFNLGPNLQGVTSAITAAPFGVSVAGQSCASIAANASCTIDVTFTPAAQQAYGGTLTLQTSAGPITIQLAGSGERSLVTHFYNAILNRPAEYFGKAYWVSEAARLGGLGANVNETWFVMAGYFFNSAEYTAQNKSNAQFVADLYNTFFNRPPDAGGQNFWANQISGGLPREVVLFSFMFSTEFRTFTAGIFGDTAARPEVDMVMDFFRGMLNRLPDTAAFNYWVNQLRTAQCQGAGAVYSAVNNISNFFIYSAEYSGRGRNHTQVVTDMYYAFLRRGGDLTGVQFWVSQLDSGTKNLEGVRQGFVASPEFGARVNAVIAAGCAA